MPPVSVYGSTHTDILQRSNMIYLLPALLAIGYLIYRLGNTPEAIEIEARMEAARDLHRHKMYKYGMRI